jgi:hypothetical protein
MDTFLDAFDLPKLSQEDINHLDWFITSNETAVFHQRKAQDQMDSLLNSTRSLKNN